MTALDVAEGCRRVRPSGCTRQQGVLQTPLATGEPKIACDAAKSSFTGRYIRRADDWLPRQERAS